MQLKSTHIPLSSKDKRRIDFNATGYPSVVNYDILSTQNKQCNIATSLNESNCQSNSNTEQQKEESLLPLLSQQASLQHSKEKGNEYKEEIYYSAPTMLTTAQLSAKLTEMSIEMQRKRQGLKNNDLTCTQSTKRVSVGSHHGVEYDERTTYRLDYSHNGQIAAESMRDGIEATNSSDNNEDDINNNVKTNKASKVATKTISNYRDDWTAEECCDIDHVMKLPYLTLPNKLVNSVSTVYRRDLIPGATREDYRLLPHDVNLNLLSSSYAYSKYGVDDPRREIAFDTNISHLTEPHSLLVPQKFYSLNSNGMHVSKSGTLHSSSMRNSQLGWNGESKKQREELERLRALRRTWAGRSTKHSANSLVNSNKSDGKCSTCLNTSAVNWNDVFGTALKADYIYLPRDTFMANKSYEC